MYDYSIFEKLCKERGVNASKVSSATGIATSTFSAWKKGDYTPKTQKLKKIADYFGVSLQYLMTGYAEERYEADMNEVADMLDQVGFIQNLSEDTKFIIETVSKWKPAQQKRLRQQVEMLNQYIGEQE